MTDANTKRVIQKLWKERHSHDEEVALQSDLVIVREQVEANNDTPAVVGAKLHLQRTHTQSLAAFTVETIEWTSYNLILESFNFVDPGLPATSWTVSEQGYYDIRVKFALASSYSGGGSVTVTRTRSGTEETIWPETIDDEVWTATTGRVFVDTAKGVDCENGDTIKIKVSHNDAGSVDLEWATVTMELVDRSGTGSDLHLGSPSCIQIADTDLTVASYNTGTWDAKEIREPDGVKYDPATDKWVFIVSGLTTGDFAELGIYTSDDQETWAAGSNPITGGTESEDGYLAKDFYGNVYRDGDGKAYLYCEERDASASEHRGINLFQSGANVLTGWTLYGRVLDKGAGGAWDDEDVSSPVVVHDGTTFHMLYEGRPTTSGGEIGYASSSDGLSFSRGGDNPIIGLGASGTWYDVFIVGDDLIKIGDRWILLAHGHDGSNISIGRFETTDSPDNWDSNSFTEMTCNPFDPLNPSACWGNDPRFVLAFNTSSPGATSAKKYKVV